MLGALHPYFSMTVLQAAVQLQRAPVNDLTVRMATAAYAVAYAAGFKYAVVKMGHENSGGSPKWRNYLGLMPQVLLMPGCLLAAMLMPTHGATLEKIFVNIFAGLIIFDLAAIRYNAMMLAHHITCLLGHIFAVSFAPEAFSSYFASVVALEAGSATSCSWWLWGDKRPRALAALYAVGMTISNMLATVALLFWAHRATTLPMAVRSVPVVITSVLMYFRQAEMHALVRGGRDNSSTG